MCIMRIFSAVSDGDGSAGTSAALKRKSGNSIDYMAACFNRFLTINKNNLHFLLGIVQLATIREANNRFTFPNTVWNAET